MFRDVLLVAKGTVLGQAPFVLASPLITRLYTPSALGVYGLAMAFVGVASPLAGLRFELAAISARITEHSRGLLLLSALAIVPVTAFSALVLGALKLSGIGSYNVLSWELVASCAATIAAAGAYSTLRCWRVRHHRFKLVANSLAVQGSIRAALPLALAPVWSGAPVLIGAELAARCASVLMLLSSVRPWRSLRHLRTRVAAIRSLAVKYWKYPVLLAPSALIDALAVALPVPIIASCYGVAVAGKFALAQRLVMLPAALISSSVGDVFHAHVADEAEARPAAVRGYAWSTAKRLLLLALAVYVPLALLAPFAAAWVFGREWQEVGSLLAVLAPACIAQSVVSPLSRSLLLNDREERKLIADLVCLILPASTLYLASSLPVVLAASCFAAASAIAFLVYFAVIVTSLETSP